MSWDDFGILWPSALRGPLQGATVLIWVVLLHKNGKITNKCDKIMTYSENPSGSPTLLYYGLRPYGAPFRGLLYCRTNISRLSTVLAVSRRVYHWPAANWRTVHKPVHKQYISGLCTDSLIRVGNFGRPLRGNRASKKITVCAMVFVGSLRDI